MKFILTKYIESINIVLVSLAFKTIIFETEYEMPPIEFEVVDCYMLGTAEKTIMVDLILQAAPTYHIQATQLLKNMFHKNEILSRFYIKVSVRIGIGFAS